MMSKVMTVTRGKKQAIYINAESLAIWKEAKALIRHKTDKTLSEVLTILLRDKVIPQLQAKE